MQRCVPCAMSRVILFLQNSVFDLKDLQSQNMLSQFSNGALNELEWTLCVPLHF